MPTTVTDPSVLGRHKFEMALARPALLSIVLCVLVFSHSFGQGTENKKFSGVQIGIGFMSMAGPEEWSNKFSLNVLALTYDIPTERIPLIRLQAGASPIQTYLGENTEATLSFYRLFAGATARFQPPSDAHSEGFPFAEIGGLVWTKIGCDIDRPAPGSFFGGETVDCEEWTPLFEMVEPALKTNSWGVSFLLNVGVSLGRYEAMIRTEPFGTALIKTANGSMRGRAFGIALGYKW